MLFVVSMHLTRYQEKIIRKANSNTANHATLRGVCSEILLAIEELVAV